MGEPCDTGGPVPGAAALVDDGEAVYMYCEVGAGGWKYDSNFGLQYILSSTGTR